MNNRVSGSIERWLDGDGVLSEYEPTDIISTLEKHEKGTGNRIKFWRVLFDLPVKKIKGDK